MIRNLNQENIKDFGTILPAMQKVFPRANHQSIALQTDSAQVYQAVGKVWLNIQSGMAVLSLSRDREQYQDFLLDRPVMLQGGVWFVLTGMQEKTSVEMAGISMPRLVQTQLVQNRFSVTPGLHVDSLYTFFYQEKELGFLFPGEAHTMQELTYVDSGTLHCVADGQDILLEQGDIVLYGPGQWHMQYADIGMAPRYVSIRFLASGCDLSGLYNRKLSSTQRAVSLLQQMLQEQAKAEAYAQDSILSLLQLLLITLLRQAGNAGEKPGLSNSVNSENEIISRAQRYISEHVQEKLSVPVVAKGVEVSPSYLTALFHKYLQIAPGEYIRRIKLQQSKQMIREGNMNFTQIAKALQYSTVHHFSRQFKEKFGITPTEYARSVR